jgi:hypothetical protein
MYRDARARGTEQKKRGRFSAVGIGAKGRRAAVKERDGGKLVGPRTVLVRWVKM